MYPTYKGRVDSTFMQGNSRSASAFPWFPSPEYNQQKLKRVINFMIEYNNKIKFFYDIYLLSCYGNYFLDDNITKYV